MKLPHKKILQDQWELKRKKNDNSWQKPHEENIYGPSPQVMPSTSISLPLQALMHEQPKQVVQPVIIAKLRPATPSACYNTKNMYMYAFR